MIIKIFSKSDSNNNKKCKTSLEKAYSAALCCVKQKWFTVKNKSIRNFTCAYFWCPYHLITYPITI